MKKTPSQLLSCFLLFLPFLGVTQTSFTDNFNDSNLTVNPTWSGETSKFEINSSKQLQLNHVGATGTNETSLVTASTTVNNALWEFYVELDFSPSTSNFAKVYLTSDSQDLTTTLNGYYVQIGGQSGTIDNVRLYRQDGIIDTLLIDGTDGTVATNPAVKIRVTKSITNEWNLFLDQTGIGNAYQLQGLSTESKYGTSSFFGVLCKYTSTRSDKFFFDDFVVSGIGFQDTSKPIVSQLSALTNNKIEVLFNEKLDSASALTLTNYSVDQSIGNPSSAIFTNLDSNKIELTFTNTFLNGSNYSLTIQNVEDIAGNTMLTSTSNFTYFIPVPADPRDIVINELYPDYTPSNGLPEAEFIELFNTSNKVFDLSGWFISDGTTNSALTTHFLRPGDFIILCSQTSVLDFQAFGTSQGLVSFPTLNNSGDAITLKDNNGNLIDFVNYDVTWYGDLTKQSGGFSLEQINPDTPCFGKNNFKASTANLGGTPGTQNSIFDTLPDLLAPQLIRVKVVSKDTILLEFNEFLDTTSFNTAKLSFNQTIIVGSIVPVRPDYQSIKIPLLNSLDSGLIYSVSIDSIRDCAGNLIQNSQELFEFFISGTPIYRDLVINELFPDYTPSNGLPENEFIELFNASNKAFNVENWVITDGSANATLLSQAIKPGEFLILCPETVVNDFQPYGATLGLAGFPSLTNAGKTITLKDNSGNTIDLVNYTDTWYQDDSKKNGGFTLEQINPFTNCTGRSNFKGSTNTSGGTPGVINSVFDISPDIKPPIILEVLVLNDSTLSIMFDERMDNASFQKTDFSVTTNIDIISIQSTAPDYELFILNLNTSLSSGIFYDLSVSNVTDCAGNAIISPNTKRIALPSNAKANDIIVNEILFNSRSGSVDFVELYNRSEKVITLQNLLIGNNEDDSISNLKELTDQPKSIFPKEYLVLTEDKADVIQQYPFGVEKNIFEIDDLPTYNDDKGTVYLLNSNSVLIDAVTYEDDYHFALLADDDGVSLERINSEQPSNDASNWHSASEKVGYATPGYKNSQDFTNPKANGNISLNPEIISPNGDGFQDLLAVNYKFNSPGFVATVSIFDKNGRLTKRLVNNELLGADGIFYWDGITDENSKARVGVYVLIFDVFNLKGDKETYKEVFTVASQLD